MPKNRVLTREQKRIKREREEALYRHKKQRRKRACMRCGGKLERVVMARNWIFSLCGVCYTPPWVKVITGSCPTCKGYSFLHDDSCPGEEKCAEFYNHPRVRDELGKLLEGSDFLDMHTCDQPNCPDCNGTGRKNGIRRDWPTA